MNQWRDVMGKEDDAADGMTHEQRVQWLREYALQGVDAVDAMSKVELRHWLDHVDRLKLIYKPFPAPRRIGTGSAMPWAGTPVMDEFMGGKQYAESGPLAGMTRDKDVMQRYYERETLLHPQDVAAQVIRRNR
jgi:hypothetical protein